MVYEAFTMSFKELLPVPAGLRGAAYGTSKGAVAGRIAWQDCIWKSAGRDWSSGTR